MKKIILIALLALISAGAIAQTGKKVHYKYVDTLNEYPDRVEVIVGKTKRIFKSSAEFQIDSANVVNVKTAQDDAENYRFNKSQASMIFQMAEDDKKFYTLSPDVSARQAQAYIARADSVEHILQLQARGYINRQKVRAHIDSLSAKAKHIDSLAAKAKADTARPKPKY